MLYFLYYVSYCKYCNVLRVEKASNPLSQQKVSANGSLYHADNKTGAKISVQQPMNNSVHEECRLVINGSYYHSRELLRIKFKDVAALH